MSVEYSLINHKHKTAYYLGTGYWRCLNEEYKWTLKSHEYLNLVIKEEMFDLDKNDEAWFYKNQYFSEVVDEIFNFCYMAPLDQLCLVNDCSDVYFYHKALNYEYVGSRYEDDDSERLKSMTSGISWTIDKFILEDMIKLGYNLKDYIGETLGLI